jgi:hypothetical protein
MDQDEVLLCKYYGSPLQLASFFYESPSLKSQNVTLVLAFTRDGSNLKIGTRVLDKDNANAVIFARTVTDSPGSDPVVPSGTVRGTPGAPDPAGTPWPLVTVPDMVGLTMQWMNSQHGPQPLAQVIFDNVEIWQYESPALAIQSAVVLSWPAAQPLFAVECAPSVNGPWTPLAAPWLRTNAAQIELCVAALDSMRFFRLQFTPYP